MPEQNSRADEVWKAVVEHEGLYEVSSFGRVRSLDRVSRFASSRTHSGMFERKVRGQMLIPTPSNGYLTCSLGANGNTRTVHQLVCTAGPRPDGQQCRNLDGVNTNNRADNLKWGTAAENAADAKRHGTSPVGEQNPGAKLTWAEVRAIRRRSAAGEALRVLARDYSVTDTNIGYIVNGKSWME